jgi:GNAT superfamily N-acetyltransferase
MTLEEFSAVWTPTLTSPIHCWRIVEAGGRPVGFGMIYLTYPQLRTPGAFVQWMYLAPDERRRGVGQQLFDQLAEWARAQGATRVELQYIDGNAIAERFWARMGFRPYARKCVRAL